MTPSWHSLGTGFPAGLLPVSMLCLAGRDASHWDAERGFILTTTAPSKSPSNITTATKPSLRLNRTHFSTACLRAGERGEVRAPALAQRPFRADEARAGAREAVEQVTEPLGSLPRRTERDYVTRKSAIKHVFRALDHACKQ